MFGGRSFPRRGNSKVRELGGSLLDQKVRRPEGVVEVWFRRHPCVSF